MNCYNGEKYLRDALESVLGQTYSNWELIFWDNQSTDASAAICKSYGDPRMRYFYAGTHTELGPARVQAFREIRGEFVAVLDADDVSHPERLARQVAFLQSRPDVALVGSWARYIDHHGRSYAEFKPPTGQDELRDCLGWHDPIVHSSTMYRYAAALRVGGYSKDLIFASDLGLILSLVEHYKIGMIDEFLCKLRVLPTSMTRSSKYRVIAARECLALVRQAAETLPLSTAARRLNRRALASLEILLGIANFQTVSKTEGMRLMARGIARDPSVLWVNGRVRRWLGADIGFLSYSRAVSHDGVRATPR
jgi:glycosyltransferase involved in cell wall biosynthesis